MDSTAFKPKLTIKQLVDYLETEKGIKFEHISKEEAEHFLSPMQVNI